jgi:hypothetical protein
MSIDTKAGGGIGSRCLTENQPAQRETPEPSMFRDERPTFWLDSQEVDRRGHARDAGIANKRVGQTGSNVDVGGR